MVPGLSGVLAGAVEHDFHLVPAADPLADLAHGLHVFEGVGPPDADLDRPVSLFGVAPHVLGLLARGDAGLVGGAGPDAGQVEQEPVAAGAPEFAQGLAGGLGDDVPEGVLGAVPGVETGLEVALDGERVLADEELAGRVGGAGFEAVSGDSGVGADAGDAGGVVVALFLLLCVGERHLDAEALDCGDLHGSVLSVEIRRR